ncbi:MAG: tRNA (adenosine(37)-N6)-threonylcarbamoyltransferase complex ATPase subunit type 1 TsaE [Verrucomicrobiae bacterium]|nr:tRNA (adenosine(37)-N6)-threonylcarbamoyltransferase complex ATPase subunit type 1 TsaE [Verrucomicrobiae bacterium]
MADSIISNSESETVAIGTQFSQQLKQGDVVALSGEMGAGKTYFVKGIAEGLGFAGEVTSPTFTLLHEYRGGRLSLWHADWYRIQSQREINFLGLDDALHEGVLVMEWPEKIETLSLTPAFHVKIEIQNETQRKISWE